MNVLILFFCFQMNCKIFFTGTTDKTRMTVHVSQTPGGAGASVSKSGIYKHLSDEKVWRRGGWGGQGGEGRTRLLAPWTINHVRAGSWPENLRLRFHNWAVNWI